jgi:uncharacterized protein YecE (DUF72 family)
MRNPRAPSKTCGRACASVSETDNRAIYIGISGWRYPEWRGKFYPEGLPHRRELKFASGIFNSIEINGSFYSLQLPSSYQRWYSETPPRFLFAVKGGRFITHMKKLRDVETPLANFFASGVLALREKIGPILWQLPPNLIFDRERLRDFLELLPRNTKEASELAAKHSEKLRARAFLKVDVSRPLRYALEVRHPSFMTADFFELLRRRKIAFVFADTAKKFPYAEDLTANFIYCRLHGDKELYASGYGDRALDWWANRIEHWREGRQPRDAKLVTERETDSLRRYAFVYFDNDAKIHAPYDAIRLAKRLAP